MAKLFITLVAIALALAPTTVLAGGFYSGNELLNLCQNQNASAGDYVAGVIDTTVTVHAAQENLQIPNICMPATSRLSQARDVVCGYLYNHPEERHFSASSTAMNVLSRAFPCK